MIKERTLNMQKGGGAGGGRVLRFFQKRFRSPGYHKPKYFMDR